MAILAVSLLWQYYSTTETVRNMSHTGPTPLDPFDWLFSSPAPVTQKDPFDFDIFSTVKLVPTLARLAMRATIPDVPRVTLDLDALYTPPRVPVPPRVPAPKLKKRKNIPKRIRDRVWDKNFGLSRIGTCYCCRDEISNQSWECSHILAAARGGLEEESNLRPCCKSCNRSMGDEHMDLFKARCYP